MEHRWEQRHSEGTVQVQILTQQCSNEVVCGFQAITCFDQGCSLQIAAHPKASPEKSQWRSGWGEELHGHTTKGRALVEAGVHNKAYTT